MSLCENKLTDLNIFKIFSKFDHLYQLWNLGLKKTQNKTILLSGPNSVFVCVCGGGEPVFTTHSWSFGFKEYPFTPWLAGGRRGGGRVFNSSVLDLDVKVHGTVFSLDYF